jgi:hypothetical protein
MFFAGGSKYCYAELVLHECVLCAALALETLLICTNACSDEGSALFAQVNAPKLIHTSALETRFVRQSAARFRPKILLGGAFIDA